MYDKALWEKCVEFHGHICPGLAIGFKASEAAQAKLNISFSSDEEIVCVTENDACGVDAIQVILGCSLGKGNLLYRDRGKSAYSFFNRTTGENIRIVLKPFTNDMSREERREFILNADINTLFQFKKPSFQLPMKAKIFNTIICEECEEVTTENKIRICNGRKLCLDCINNYSRGW